MEWQPIETVPHDVLVLLFGRTNGEIMGWRKDATVVIGKYYGASGWVEETEAYSISVHATHWAQIPDWSSLPVPPAEDER